MKGDQPIRSRTLRAVRPSPSIRTYLPPGVALGFLVQELSVKTHGSSTALRSAEDSNRQAPTSAMRASPTSIGVSVVPGRQRIYRILGEMSLARMASIW